MKKSVSNLILVILVLSLAACVNYPPRKKSEPVKVLGNSEASLKLSYGAAEQIWYTLQEKNFCKEGVESINRSVVETSPDFSKSSTGQIIKGYVKERWDASGCGKTFPFDVKFEADGVGGIDVYTSPAFAK